MDCPRTWVTFNVETLPAEYSVQRHNIYKVKTDNMPVNTNQHYKFLLVSLKNLLTTKKAGSLKFWYLYTKLHSIIFKEDTIFIRTDLNFNSTSPHGHMSVRWIWVEIHQTKTWWTKPAIMQNGHSEVCCKLSDKIMSCLFVVTNTCWVSVYWLLPFTLVPV